MMRSFAWWCVAALPSASLGVTPNFTYTYSYLGEEQLIKGLEPDGNDTQLPVFLWFGGTGDSLFSPVDITWLEAMTARGFVAATVKYPNSLHELLCTWIFDGGFEGFQRLAEEKGQTIVESALRVVCAHPRVDCNYSGVALAGHSQGGFIIQAGVQHAPDVTAALVLGVGCPAEDRTLIPEFRSDAVSNYLPRENRLIVTGGKDDLHDEQCLQDLSGYNTSGQQYDGSGYMVVPGGAHTFYGEHTWTIEDSRMNCEFRDGVQPWALAQVTDWLAMTASPSKAILPLSGFGYPGVSYFYDCANTSVSDNDAPEDIGVPGCFVAAFGISFLGLLCCCCCCCVCYCYCCKCCCFKKGKVDTKPLEVSV